MRWPAPLAPLAAAVIFLTRVPLPFHGPMPDDLNRRAMGWFPLVGAGVGALGGLAFWAAAAAGLPPLASALLSLAAMALTTGCFHEDGLADVADGFGGGRTREAKLEIMHDSRVGTFGSMALVLGVGLRAAALAAISDPAGVMAALTASGALSRAPIPAIVRGVPPARADGLATRQGRPGPGTAALAVATGLAAAAVLLPGATALAAVAAVAGASAVMVHMARRQVGGYTGDVLGATQQVGEVALLLTVAALTRPT
ncbi:MAG TPA: adenosylcobinamide-GDP ribazoletransferase [Azospirillaceae bacterium]|nr:adenosylcobinamide-GDP ribazoletransferase [Azospirillaceae bacterium]